MPFFAQHGPTLKLLDLATTKQLLVSFDSSVPDRIAGAQAHHRERYTLVRYVACRAEHNVLHFPATLSRNTDTTLTAPDFFLDEAGQSRVGIEHTDAGSELSQRARTELERAPPGSFLIGEATIVRPGETAPLAAPSSFEDWTRLIGEAVQGKLSMTEAENTHRLPAIELLVYDNIHWQSPLGMSASRFRDLEASLRTILPGGVSPFSRISVLSAGTLLFNVLDRPSLLSVPTWMPTP